MWPATKIGPRLKITSHRGGSNFVATMFAPRVETSRTRTEKAPSGVKRVAFIKTRLRCDSRLGVLTGYGNGFSHGADYAKFW